MANLRRGVGILSALTVSTLLLSTPANASTLRPGAPGVGDAYFPLAGNGGYDVQHYAIDVRYEPATRAFTGITTISARATAGLSSFDLDLRGFTVRSVRVDGRPAAYTRRGQELIVVPSGGIPAGRWFSVQVCYDGTTGRPVDDTGALYGWVSTPDGAFVANEPDAASTWYPVNDHPTDKASYDFRITVACCPSQRHRRHRRLHRARSAGVGSGSGRVLPDLALPAGQAVDVVAARRVPRCAEVRRPDVRSGRASCGEARNRGRAAPCRSTAAFRARPVSWSP